MFVIITFRYETDIWRIKEKQINAPFEYFVIDKVLIILPSALT